jgi:hypothetical protein
MAWYSGFYCPNNHNDINVSAVENHIKHLSSNQYHAFKTHLTVMVNLEKEVEQQVETV